MFLECNIREKLQYAIKVENMFLSKLIVIILLQVIKKSFNLLLLFFMPVMKHFACVDR